MRSNMRMWTGRPTGLKNPHLASSACRKALPGENAGNHARHPGYQRSAHILPRTPSYLRTRRRKTPKSQILLPNAQRSFTCTTQSRIQLLDDDEEEMPQRSKRARNVSRQWPRTVNTPDGAPRDMGSIIRSREKIRIVEMSEVDEIEKQIPDAYKLRDELIDARYVEAEDYLDALDHVARLLRYSIVDVVGTMHMRHAQQRRELEALHLKAFKSLVNKVENGVTEITKSTLKLNHEFVLFKLERTKRHVAEMERYFRLEFMLPRISAIRRVDSRLAHSERVQEQYVKLQAASRVVVSTMTEIGNICQTFKHLNSSVAFSLQQVGHSLLLSAIKEFGTFAHAARADWLNYQMLSDPMQKAQDWRIQGALTLEYPPLSPRKVMELIVRGNDSEEYAKLMAKDLESIAPRLRQKYMERWQGPKPQNSPEMDKAWRQLDIMAPLEMFRTHLWLIHVEVQYLISTLRGLYGPMFDNSSRDVINAKTGLFAVYYNILRLRKDVINQITAYKYVNWARMESDDRLHRLGLPNVSRERGYLVAPKPLSQDLNRFVSWTNDYARVSSAAWKMSRVLEVRNCDGLGAPGFMRMMTRLHNSIYEEQVFHVPELGSKRARVKRAIKSQRQLAQQDKAHAEKSAPSGQFTAQESSYETAIDEWTSASLEVPLPDFDLDDDSLGDHPFAEDETPAQESMDDETPDVKGTAHEVSPGPVNQPNRHLNRWKSIFGSNARPSSRAYSTYREILSREHHENSRVNRYSHEWKPIFGSRALEPLRKYSTHRDPSSKERHEDVQGESYEAAGSRGINASGESTIGSLEHIDPEVEDDGPQCEGIDSKSLFWSHNSQTRPDGGRLIVHYCRSLDSTEEVVKHFLKSPVVGFDMEWKSNASANHSIQSNLSLIQIANEERIALFQIALFKPARDLSDLVAPSLRQLMESPQITKVGVSIKADTTRLRKYLGIEAVSIFELSHLYRLVKYGQSNPKLVNKRNINLSDQVKEHLGLPLKKTEDVRCSDWARPLSYNQVQYAATDPYASFCLFHALEQKRLAMNPVPPRPAHAELNLPITLPFGGPVNEETETPLMP